MHELLTRVSTWLWPALANHLWQATLFAALVFGVTLLLRDGPARLRYALWLVAAAKFAVPSALFAPAAAWLGVGSLWRADVEPSAAGPLFLRITEPVAADARELVVGVSGARTHEELFCVLTVVWLAGCAALVAVWLRRRHEFQRSLRAGMETWAGREFEALGRARARLGMKREVLLVLSQGRTEPGVWRTLRPVLLLPSEVASQLDDEELEAVVLHELAHVERRDNLFANLQTALACVFWFNPAVWLIGRRLFAERESACDERVVEASGAAGAYAAGILKVVRFCSGWRVAGVAGVASGSNLRRRIEMIMRGEKGGVGGAWQRAAVSGLAAAALALTVGAGLFGRGSATAHMLEGADGTPQEAKRVEARVRRGGAESRAQEAAIAEVTQAQEAVVFFEQPTGGPVSVAEVKMRMITREKLRRANAEGADNFDDKEAAFFLTLPTVTLANISSKAIREVGIGFETGGRVSVITGYAASMRPGESQTFSSDWRSRNVIFPGTFADVKVRVMWVEFVDGTQWGARARVPHPPEPPPAPRRPGEPPPPPSADDPGEGADNVRVIASGRGEDVTVARSGGGGGVARSADAGEGAGFGEGRGEGSDVDVARSGGGGRGAGLGDKLYAPQPTYPPIAKAAGAEGSVGVRVTVDEEGNVVAAEAISGHPLLKMAAVDAARQSKFKPAFVEGKPVKVTGVISYDFKLK
jgi:TonB family protein